MAEPINGRLNATMIVWAALTVAVVSFGSVAAWSVTRLTGQIDSLAMRQEAFNTSFNLYVVTMERRVSTIETVQKDDERRHGDKR